ncbi:Hydroxyproline O-arabinosyltransferase 1 [Vitis vinifera]|uniref:Hydroxyproline O-arabinosyltransferase 1 n=1 Tax=Vitis vinifera TaxID=29760 RepID=A0A438KEX2_VITVI|nr:Hydroxyproline O-arabinosyltransferase 1 [Vitis vinifera]
MGCGNFFYVLLITFSVALITYNILISANAPLKQGFPGHPSSSSTPFSCRVMYYWFKKFKDGPNSEMGGFTRILHSGKPDKFMHEIPTFVAQPLPAGMDQHGLRFLRILRKLVFSSFRTFKRIHSSQPPIIPGLCLLKSFLWPMTLLALRINLRLLLGLFAQGAEDTGYIVLNRPWAFVQWLQQADIKEDYILMAEPDHIIVKPIPNLSRDGLGAAFPFFYIQPKKYAYAVASALHDVGNILFKDFMIQPPWDTEIGKKFIIHYTYGCDYDMQGKLTYGKIGEWRFDKRSFDSKWPPRNLPLPPPGVPESVVTLVKMVNEATANIPNWGS